MATSQYSTCNLPDGATLAYEVLGGELTATNMVPLVLVCGMASTRADWVRLSPVFAQSRPVLIYDHRGMGDSKHPLGLHPGGDEFTIETLARDLAYLIGHLGWSEAAFLGFSMGGVVVQQMLVLPYLPQNPLSLVFRPTHVILASTRSEVLSDPRHGLQTVPEPPSKPPTDTERYENIRKTIEATVDPAWIKAYGKQYLGPMIQGVISGRPRSLHTISRQRKALQLFDFKDLLAKIPKQLPVLVLHGEADQIIPFECSQETLRSIRGAKFVQVGTEPGMLPSLQFGHNFTLYFPVKSANLIPDPHQTTTAMPTQRLLLPDGAKLAYDILGAEKLNHASPIVLVGGVSSRRIDWNRLSTALGRVRPGNPHYLLSLSVHLCNVKFLFMTTGMGIGDSELADRDEKHTIELLARDLLLLLEHLGWKELSICGFSMGGVVVQQLLLLPYHPERPTPLPFAVTHVFLTGSLPSPLRDSRYGLPVPPPPTKVLSEQEKMDIARHMLDLSFDPVWLSDPGNASRIDQMLIHRTSKRPSNVIWKQLRAMNRFDFTDLHAKLPRSIKFMVINGELDRIVPPYSAQDIKSKIPWAESVEIGPNRGMVPTMAFGHSWYEYFDVEVWVEIIEAFIARKISARL
ncbi:Hydrolase-4 domain-containing protein [Mycena indigotica]|uniref:Hydrolase-4 domain-containing protein n=1 Tax=Mycena indigotica TaxID=2126181 RepID=A0A8H6VVM9_9AGAR|nr:Hydrolase-4 domain-containing protein [Mycena indigotica]KAF7295577.1 Hydrolase-4 domain-containing protein [Mycena indigotica]